MKKLWKVNPVDRGLIEALARELGILPLTARLLINRGLVSADRASVFLRPELSHLHDPFLLKDMDLAVERIVSALGAGEKIAVYGDYDVDGTTASAVLYQFFRELGVTPVCYMPRRLKEGYGLNMEALKRLGHEGVKVVITVDCGITDIEEVRFARSMGMDVIITDHHEVPERLPDASAVINPKQPGCRFPFKGLAGVGVAFNLVVALRARLRKNGWFRGEVPNLKRYLDLVCIGTVADMVPLVDENRVFVSFGLGELRHTKRVGLRALKDAAGLGSSGLSSESIAYQIAPRINAAGRLGDAKKAFRLLTTEDPAEARALARELDSENSKRQRIEEETLSEALEMLGGEVSEKGIVLSREGWHPGVIGIVASRLVDRFFRPVVLIALDDGVGRGSVRGIEPFDVIEGLRNCSDHLERYGGHKAAAGLTLSEEQMEAFRRSFLDYIDRAVTEEDLVREIKLDAVISLNELDLRALDEIQKLSPHGCANREPLLGVTGADILSTEVVGARHLRFRVRHDNSMRSGIGFGLADLHPIRGSGFDIAFHPYLDEWQGMKSPRLRIKDIRPAQKIP